MARKSMVVKQSRKPKYKVREYTRCARCGRPHAVMSKLESAVFASVNWLIKDKYQALKNQAGRKGGKKML